MYGTTHHAWTNVLAMVKHGTNKGGPLERRVARCVQLYTFMQPCTMGCMNVARSLEQEKCKLLIIVLLHQLNFLGTKCIDSKFSHATSPVSIYGEYYLNLPAFDNFFQAHVAGQCIRTIFQAHMVCESALDHGLLPSRTFTRDACKIRHYQRNFCKSYLITFKINLLHTLLSSLLYK